MRRLALAVALFGAFGGFAGSAAAEPPDHFVEELDVSFQSGFWTARCGFPVIISAKGTLRLMLRTDADGTVHEIDTFSSFRFGFTAPSTGETVEYMIGPGFFEYPEGTDLGDPAIVTFVGIASKAPGLPANAGRQVFDAVIIAHDPHGIPIIATIGPPASESGHFGTAAEFQAAVCAALAG